MASRKRWFLIAGGVLLLLGAIAGGVWFFRREQVRREVVIAPKPEAPPDLEKLRGQYAAALEAMRRGDGPGAVHQFSAFSFRKRAVEEYRLFHLATSYDLEKNLPRARVTLAQLWSRRPALVYWPDAGRSLSAHYRLLGDWRHVAEVSEELAARATESNVAANARWSALESRFVEGDLGAVLLLSRSILIKNPRSRQAAGAVAIVRSVTGVPEPAPIAMTEAERLERAVALLRDGDPQSAARELQALQAVVEREDLKGPVALNLGLALNQLRRYEDSNRVLERLTSGSYRVAVPAIYTASKNYRALSTAINPMVIKSVVVKQQVGTVKVRVKGAKGKKKFVLKPKFANVKKNVQLVDLAKKTKKDSYERLSAERLKDLLSLPLSKEIRVEVLNTLIAMAEPKNQDEYEQTLIRQLVEVDPGQDPGLQHFWDKAWGLYSRGDFGGAQSVLAFLRDTYRSPNLKRQAGYWHARCAEKLGDKEGAKAVYAQLATAPYDDLYALESERRGAVRPPAKGNPFAGHREDWREIAERSMPKELRLAYELTALSDTRDALAELKMNRSGANQQFADALLSELYSSTGDTTLMMLTLKRAFPQLATVEQDAVPPYFLRMYYPAHYQSDIRKYSEKNGVDPFIVMGLIHQESYFNPKSKSVVGATGLMQLMPATGKELARRLHTSTNLEDPITNIKLGTAHFKMLMNLFRGNTDLAIASYNAGQGRIMQWRRAAPGRPMDEFVEAIPFRETRTYVKHVVMLASTYRRINPQ